MRLILLLCGFILLSSCIPSAKIYTTDTTKSEVRSKTYLKNSNIVVNTKTNSQNPQDIVIREIQLDEYVREQSYGYKVAVAIQTFLFFLCILWYFFLDPRRKLEYINDEVNEQKDESEKEEKTEQHNTKLD